MIYENVITGEKISFSKFGSVHEAPELPKFTDDDLITFKDGKFLVLDPNAKWLFLPHQAIRVNLKPISIFNLVVKFSWAFISGFDYSLEKKTVSVREFDITGLTPHECMHLHHALSKYFNVIKVIPKGYRVEKYFDNYEFNDKKNLKKIMNSMNSLLVTSLKSIPDSKNTLITSTEDEVLSIFKHVRVFSRVKSTKEFIKILSSVSKDSKCSLLNRIIKY